MNKYTRRNLIIDLPKGSYRILNAPAPRKRQLIFMVAGILASAFLFAVIG